MTIIGSDGAMAKYLDFDKTYDMKDPIMYKALDYFIEQQSYHNSYVWIYRACGVMAPPSRPAPLTSQDGDTPVDIYVFIRIDVASNDPELAARGHDSIPNPHVQSVILTPYQPNGREWLRNTLQHAYPVRAECLREMLASETFPCADELYDQSILPEMQRTLNRWKATKETQQLLPKFDDLQPVGRWQRRFMHPWDQWNMNTELVMERSSVLAAEPGTEVF